MKFNPNSEDLSPRETALVVAAEGLNMKLRSRAHLLAVIDALDFSKESVDSRMVYVMALMSLGFSRSRAIKRLGLTKGQAEHWKRSGEENRDRFYQAQSRGELMLEETVLLAAERDPQWAQAVLLQRDREKEEEPEKKDTYDATAYLKKGKLKKVDPLE